MTGTVDTSHHDAPPTGTAASRAALAALRAAAVALAVALAMPAAGQRGVKESYFDFRVNATEIDPAYMDNARSLADLVEWLEAASADTSLVIESVMFAGLASPEGGSVGNIRLSRSRGRTVERFVRQRVDIPDSIVVHDGVYVPWSWLEREVAASTDIPYKDEVLAIIAQESDTAGFPPRKEDPRVTQLRRLRGGAVWPVLLNGYFVKMRRGCVVIATVRPRQPEALSAVPVLAIEQPAPAIEPPAMEPEPLPAAPARHWYLKSNGVGWLMLAANAAAELELSDSWSVSVPVYYSALNYFTERLKFRTFCLQPEVRYWPWGCGGRLYVGAHATVAWWNYAACGDYRRQGHSGEVPAWGGGLGAGWRIPLGNSGRWFMEFTAGAGVYGLYYDKYENRHNGQRVGTYHKTFFCIDNAAVTVAYRFDIKSK